MNFNVLIPLVSAGCYAVLIFVIFNSGLNKLKLVFIFYLAATMLWSLSSFFVHANFFPGNTLLIHEFMVVFGYLTPIAFFYFAAKFTNRGNRLLIILSVILFIAIVVLDFSGFILLSSKVVDYELIYKTSLLYYAGLLLTFTFLGFGTVYLIQKYRVVADPLERNRVAYLIISVGIDLIFVCTLFFSATSKYPLDHVGNVIVAFIITYAILKYKLFNIKLIARKVTAYALLIVPISGVYAGLLFLGMKLFPTAPMSNTLIFSTGLAIVMAVISRSVWHFIPRAVDRWFYSDTYEPRNELLNLGNKLGSVINLTQLADEILPPLCQVMQVNTAKLLLRDVVTGTFSSQFSFPQPKDGESEDISFGLDNPMITWLERKNRPLELRQITTLPEFKALWREEKEQISRVDIGLLTPIKHNGELIGIFIIGKKQRNSPYSQEDLEMMMTVSNQAGIIIENAQHYSQALLKANTDGLTALYNHRHFHERLEQEISRSSRFGTVFSLIMMDIDLFKIYNDNYGHLAGDEVLRRIGDYVRGSIRNIDIAARYGGEEFVIILPETRLVDAYVVAERIRKTVETKTSQKAMPVTLSLGVACWPVDGVMKEELISRADKALYLAKENGRNRTSISTEIADMETKKSEIETNPKALSIIYALAATVDAKDHYTYGHSRKVSEYAVTIANALKLSHDRIEIIKAAGLLHDIGKIGIPDLILNKKEPLSPEEWEPIKGHTQLGVAILRHIVDLSDCLPAIQYHHEHFDGSGYPAGLRGENIPLESRILSIADAYEAMTSLRAYRKQLSASEAIEELKRTAGTQFDPEIVPVFCKILESNPVWKQ